MIENVILRALLKDESFTRKVIPHMKKEYFQDRAERAVFEGVASFLIDYNAMPTLEAIGIGIGERKDLSEDDFESAKRILSLAEEKVDDPLTDWLIDKTEQFCQERAMHNAIVAAMKIINEKGNRGLIPSLVQDALGVSFDNNVGHDFVDSAEERFEAYQTNKVKVPFGLDTLNMITNGGFEQKTYNVWMGGTHAGKSLLMNSCAAQDLIQRRNVLYITCELSQEMLERRLDAHILGIDYDMVSMIPRDDYMRKFRSIREAQCGKLIVKEYPMAVAHAGHFRHLINELRIKKKFEPDIIYIDYLNVLASQRMEKMTGTHDYYMFVSQEVRGLSTEFLAPIVTAAQFNREGAKSEEPNMTEVASSWGSNWAGDFICSMVATEDHVAANQLLFIQQKNRYRDKHRDEKFLLGINRAQFKLFDVPQGEVQQQAASLHRLAIAAKMSGNNGVSVEGFK